MEDLMAERKEGSLPGSARKLINKHKKKEETLANAQRTQGDGFFRSLNKMISKQKLQQVLKSWSNFSLVLFGRAKKYIEQLCTNLCNNLNKSMNNIDNSFYSCIKFDKP